MLLGFKDQFELFVVDGSKTHSVRGYGKRRPWLVGDIADCYVRPRQKGMRLLGRWKVTKVERIRIAHGNKRHALTVSIDGSILSADEVDLFFWRDGFRPKYPEPEKGTSMRMAANFWPIEVLPFYGQLIHWDYSNPVNRFSAAKSGGKSKSRTRQSIR